MKGSLAAPSCHRSEFKSRGKRLLVSGGIVAGETAREARTCHVQVHHDAEHVSTIQLPVR
jgi:hypothetical protein